MGIVVSHFWYFLVINIQVHNNPGSVEWTAHQDMTLDVEIGIKNKTKFFLQTEGTVHFKFCEGMVTMSGMIAGRTRSVIQSTLCSLSLPPHYPRKFAHSGQLLLSLGKILLIRLNSISAALTVELLCTW